MKYEIADCEALSVKEVADQLAAMDALNLDTDEYVGDCRLEFGCDLEIDIHKHDDMDKRIDGICDRTETFTLEDIKVYFTAADYYAWAKDEDGDDVLLCFGC